MDIDLQSAAKQARWFRERGRHAEALPYYRMLCGDPNTVESAYDDWLRGLAECIEGIGQPRPAAYVHVYLQAFDRALAILDGAELAADRARVLDARGSFAEAAELYGASGLLVQAAIAWERAGEALTPEHRAWSCAGCGASNELHGVAALPLCRACGLPWVAEGSEAAARYGGARSCWERLRNDGRLRGRTYETALVHFNLGTCCLRLGDASGMEHLVTAQRLLEEAADAFETAGQRERAFDCYQILLEMGRRSGAFENLAEGFINCIRILKEDNLKYYVLQYYEDFLREALSREEFHAAAALYRAAADFCLRSGLIYDRHYMQAAANAWLEAANETLRRGGPPEMAENDCLAAVECFNAIGDYVGVGRCYRRLAELGLARHATERYERIARRYRDASREEAEPQAFPDYLRQPHAYPDIWYMDLVEWELDGDPAAICAAVIGDARYPEVVRRRALNLLLQTFEGITSTVEGRAFVAERLGDFQIYPVLSALEKLYASGEVLVQQGVMRAVQYLFFKRSFTVLVQGLRAADQGTRQAAIESLGRLYFPHAFDPLVRIFREFGELAIRRTTLASIGKIAQLQAGDFLLEVLRYEPEPLRSDAKQLIAGFQNRELFAILRQHCDTESGPVRAELEEILRQASWA